MSEEISDNLDDSLKTKFQEQNAQLAQLSEQVNSKFQALSNQINELNPTLN